MIPPTPPRDTGPPVGSPIPLSPSSLVGSSSPVRSTTPPPDYPFDESIFAELKVLKFEIECKDIAIRKLRKKLEITQKEKDSIQFNVDKFENASKSLDKLIECQIVDSCKKGLGYNAVPPPYTGNFMPLTPDLTFTGFDEFVNKHVVENRKSDEEVSKGNLQMDLQDQGVIDSGCSRHMTGNMSYLIDYEEIDCTKDEPSGILKSFITRIENLVDHKVKVIRCDNGTEFKNKEMNHFVRLSKAFRVSNSRTRIMEKELAYLGTQSNAFAGTKESDNVVQARKETYSVKNNILLPLWPADLPYSQDPKSSQDDGFKPSNDDRKKVGEEYKKKSEKIDQEKDANVNNTNNVNVASTNEVNFVGRKTSIKLLDDPNMPALEDISIFDLSRDNEDVGAEADMNNLDTTI
ncbi:hypothetical protein Tco_0661447 [Tanacetum coccineum]